MFENLSGVWKTIGGGLTAAGIIGAAYTFGKDAGEKELEVYKAAKQINFEALATQANDAAAAMRKATTEFSAMLVSNKSYDDLKSNLDESNNNNKELVAKYQATLKKLDQKERDFDQIVSELASITEPEDVFTIYDGKSIQVGGNILSIGLTGSYGFEQTLNINGTTTNVKAGDVLSSEHGNIYLPNEHRDLSCTIHILELALHEPVKLTAKCPHKAK